MSVNANKQSLLNKGRVDKFIMVFQLPPALREVQKRSTRSSFNVSEDSFQFSIYGTIVPELTVPAVRIPYTGSNLYQSAHAREPYPPVTINFTIDNEFNNYWVIYKWLDLMHDDKAGLYDNDKLVGTEYSNYQADMTIYGVDEYDNKRIQFTYTKAFPTVLGNIEYNYRESTEINTSMTFVYSQLHTKLLNL
jgi:hypothetical protein